MKKQKQFKIQKKTKSKQPKPSKSLYVRFCPRCRSINVDISHQGFLSGLTALGLPTVYRCRDCGFSSKMFPEVNFNEVKKRKGYKIKI